MTKQQTIRWQRVWWLAAFLLLAACGGAADEPTLETGAEAPAGEAVETVEEAEESTAEEIEAEVEAEFEGGGFQPEATGSEEGGGSPFSPDKGVKIAPTRIASAGWVDMKAVLNDEGMMRLIEETDGEIVVIHQLASTAGRSMVMITSEQLFFSQWTRLGVQSSPVEQAAPAGAAAALSGLTPTDALVEQSVLLTCDRCHRGGSEETLVILWPAAGLTLTMDQNEPVPAVEPLLSLMRQTHEVQRQAAAARAFRLNQ